MERELSGDADGAESSTAKPVPVEDTYADLQKRVKALEDKQNGGPHYAWAYLSLVVGAALASYFDDIKVTVLVYGVCVVIGQCIVDLHKGPRRPLLSALFRVAAFVVGYLASLVV